LLQLGRTSWSC